ncbi:FkbM family methyltransferase [Roseobacter sp. HKCCD8831]|uniref:FkbM family methyltransferase n=1 Tax=Roseobacter sp. HKCCD8831 TaxID=2690624 RepID=UPI001C0ECC2E
MQLKDMIEQDLIPRGWVERGFAAFSGLPNPIGWMMYRKLKRRMANRASARFDSVVANLGPDDVVIDLGANVGDITDVLAKHGASVYAFEPEPSTYAALSEKMAGRPNVTVINSAVSDFDGHTSLVLPASFRDNPRSASKAASIVHERYKSDQACEVEVKVTDFARFLAELGSKVTLIKVDIEGAEWPVLKALRDADLMDKFDMMFVETHERFDVSTVPSVKQHQAWAAGLTRPYINLFWK